jgi:2-polyprenyl-6-hydroxyphenyl methylase/3-demethylubiquinone-9 3-methyltransferase
MAWKAARKGSSTLAEVRFAFGDNWRRYLRLVDPARVAAAERSLTEWLGELHGRSFLDVGSGSGLFSLAARRLGARVTSFDYDTDSVTCTAALRNRYFKGDPNWTVEQGSVLDLEFLRSLGSFDVVYCWGVLSFSGDLRKSLGAVTQPVREGGLLWIAVYQDLGRKSVRWRRIKRLYNRTPSMLRFLILGPAFVRLWGPTTARDLLHGRPFATWRLRRANRGMDPWRDVVDWVGGYPYEVATAGDLFDYYRGRGFTLEGLRVGGANNELLLRRTVQGG